MIRRHARGDAQTENKAQIRTLIQPHTSEYGEFAALVRAAAVCGCSRCRRTVNAWLVRRQADDAFARALADLAAVIGLPWVIRPSAA